MHVRLAQGPKPRRTADQAKVCDRKKRQLGVYPWATGARSGGPLAHPRTPARLRVGGLGMAADLRKQAAGRPGAQQRGSGAGSGPAACERKRIELWPMQGPPPRQQSRLQASRGSCGQWNDIGPGGTRSARGDHQQAPTPLESDRSTAVAVRGRATSVGRHSVPPSSLRGRRMLRTTRRTERPSSPNLQLSHRASRQMFTPSMSPPPDTEAIQQ